MSSDVEKLLINLGYRLINARYGGICTNCSQSYEAGDDIYWKRDENKTYSVCPRCYSNKNGAKRRQVTCPHCGRTFEIADLPRE